jgi:thiol-disulfide isomerase/thioredoxin
MREKLEQAANIAILVLAGLIVSVVAGRYMPSASNSGIVAVGDRISLANLDGKSGQTLAVILQSNCHFCSESAPFYSRLVNEARGHQETHLMAIFPQDPGVGSRYLKQLGVEIGDVRQAKLGDMKIKGTPTLLLLGRTGIAERMWLGRLSAQQESEVLHVVSAPQAQRF